MVGAAELFQLPVILHEGIENPFKLCILIHMLNKRINILLEKEKYLRLIQLARLEGVSVSEMIRRAVSKLYFSESKSRK